MRRRTSVPSTSGQLHFKELALLSHPNPSLFLVICFFFLHNSAELGWKGRSDVLLIRTRKAVRRDSGPLAASAPRLSAGRLRNMQMTLAIFPTERAAKAVTP